MTDWGVSPPGKNVQDDIFLVKDVNSVGAVEEGLHLKVEKPRVLDRCLVLLVTKYTEERFVVEVECEAGKTQDEETCISSDHRLLRVSHLQWDDIWTTALQKLEPA